MTSVHKNPSYKNRVAVAPYNFVPLPEAVLTLKDTPPPHDRYDVNLLTGKLSCRLTTASPLYVRAARTLDEYNHKNGDDKSEPITPSDPYYGQTKDELLIPGSSLRGMLRNLVEVVSYSRVSSVTKKTLFFRTVDVSSIGKAYGKRMSGGDAGEQGWYTLAKAGYMEVKNGDFFIRPAKELFGTQHYRVKEDIALKAIPNLKNMAYKKDNGKWAPNKDYRWTRQPVWFKPVAPTSHLPESPTYYADVTEVIVQENKPDGSGWERGYFMAGGWVPSPKSGRGKHRHWIIGPHSEDETNLIRISDEDIELYKEHTGGFTQAVDRNKMSVLPAKAGQSIPCFYTFWKDEDGQERLAFGHTGMFRLPYQQSPGQMLPDAIKNVDGYDLAEAMFGFVDQGKSERGAVASRVFVMDAKFDGDPKQAIMNEKVFSDQALSGPKPTTVQHYLNQSDPDHPENLKHYDSNANSETSLRGHKFYWHAGASADFERRLARAPQQRPTDKLNRFKPVKEDQNFTFDIHFENLRPEELGALLWVLDKAADPHYRLKLGMGKSYGLGSIGITYDVSLTNRALRYVSLFEDDNWNTGLISKTEKNSKIDESKKRFSDFVLLDERVNSGNAKDIDELPRIKELLALLNWMDRPSEEKTRYMELDEFTGRKHIFTELTGRPSRRPVLPTPTKVIDNHWFAGLPGEEPRSKTNNLGGRQGAHQTASTVAPPSIPRPLATPRVITPPPSKRERPPKPERPTPVEKETSKLEITDVILGIVEKATGAGKEVSLILPRSGDKDRAIIPAGTSTIHRYKKDEKVLLRVTGIDGDSNIGYRITCEPVEI